MRKYFIDSFRKLRSDALSKVLYDLLKWLVIATVLYALSYLIPWFKRLQETKISFSVYTLVLSASTLIILSIVLVTVVYRRKYQEIRKLNQIDELTGLKNHKAFKDYLTNRLEELGNATATTMSIILIDIDDFKQFNTRFGYNTADQVLRNVGEFLNNDRRATDQIFRKFSRGDEFVVVVNETNLHGAFLAAERKRKLIEGTRFTVEGKSYSLTVSCGVTEFKRGQDDFTSITDRVNLALTEAKAQSGKNCTKRNF